MQKKRKIILFSILVGLFLIIGGAFYSWYFEVLPQVAIHLLGDIDQPTNTDRILIFSPHPDDETLAAGGFIHTSIEADALIWIVLVTDGNKHGLEQKRYEEFKKAVNSLGVPEKQLFFLGYPDGGLNKENKSKIESRFRNIISQVDPTIIIAPHPKDTHSDHIVTGQIIQILAQDSEFTLYQYLVHHSSFPHPKKFAPQLYLLPPIRMVNFDTEWRRFILSPQEEDLKHKIVLNYKSQIKIYTKSLLFGMIRQNELFALPKE